MMNLKNKIKNFLLYSKGPAKIFTFVSKPFSRHLRHINNTPKINNKKKITAVVPNYNYSKYLKKRINTIVNQKYKIDELIILDDCSTDDSDKVINDIIKDLKVKHADILVKYIKNTQNSGKSIIQWEKAFSMVENDFIWIAEADDYSDPDFLSTAMSAFDDEEVVLSYTNSVAVNDDDFVLTYDFARFAGKEKKEHFKKSYILDGREEIKSVLGQRCTIPNVSAVVFRKKSDIPFQKYLKEAERFTQVGDWYFYLKVLQHGKIAFNVESRNYFRISSASVTAKSRNTKVHEEEISWIHNHFKSL